MTVQDAAAKVAHNYAGLSGNAEAAFDPSTILVFANLIIPIIQQIQKCIQANQVPTKAQNPTASDMILMNMTVRREIGWHAFRQSGRHYVSSLIKTAAESTPEDMTALYTDVDSQQS